MTTNVRWQSSQRPLVTRTTCVEGLTRILPKWDSFDYTPTLTSSAINQSSYLFDGKKKQIKCKTHHSTTTTAATTTTTTTVNSSHEELASSLLHLNPVPHRVKCTRRKLMAADTSLRILMNINESTDSFLPIEDEEQHQYRNLKKSHQEELTDRVLQWINLNEKTAELFISHHSRETNCLISDKYDKRDNLVFYSGYNKNSSYKKIHHYRYHFVQNKANNKTVHNGNNNINNNISANSSAAATASPMYEDLPINVNKNPVIKPNSSAALSSFFKTPIETLCKQQVHIFIPRISQDFESTPTESTDDFGCGDNY